jgi:hypothetical protein
MSIASPGGLNSNSQESLLMKDLPIENKDNNNNNNNLIKSMKEKYKISERSHPLEFYALGKIDKNIYNNPSTLYGFSSSRFRTNNSSHDLFNRNILSVNNSNFDNLKKVKDTKTLFEINKEGNNYLNPALIYKIREEENKEAIKRNNINSLQWLNLVKNKLFSFDLNSKVKKGKNITRNKFYEIKNKTIISPRKIINDSSKRNSNSYNNSSEFKNKNNLSEGLDYNYNTNYSIDNFFSYKRFKKDNDNLCKLVEYTSRPYQDYDYWKKLKIQKSYSTDELINKDSKKFDEKILKSNMLFFDKNHKNIVRDRNWWIIDK